MRKNKVIGFLSVALVVGTLAFSVLWLSESPLVDAQTTVTPEEIRQKKERDNSLTDDRLNRVKNEAVLVQDAILGLMKKNFRKYDLVSNDMYGPETGGLGRRGQMTFKSDWKKGKTQFGLQITFVFSPEEAEKFHLKKLNEIAMGEGSLAPEPFGKDAVIIKNVQFNKTMTWVALHFRKGRLMVSGNINNGSRTNTQNEKELLEIMEAIYPILVAKEKFEDV